jgi:hypothetical protein
MADIENMTDAEFSVYMENAIAKDEVGVTDDDMVEITTDTIEVENDDNDTDEDDVEIEDDLEQPDTDSSEETDNDEDVDTDDDEFTKDPDTDNEATDEDAETDEGQPEVIETEAETVTNTHMIKADGTEFEFTTEELKLMASKGINYTKKMQEMAKWKRPISILAENNLTENDLNLMVDVLKGDKDAISTILKRTGVDALELDVEQAEKYQPKQYGKSDLVLDIEEVEARISRDPEYTITRHVVSNQWDEVSQIELAKNPEQIEELHVDIKNGTFDKVSPIMIKLKALDGAKKSDLEYYLEAGAQYYTKLRTEQAYAAQKAAAKAEKEKLVIEQAKTLKNKQNDISKKRDQRKAAATTVKSSGKPSITTMMDVDSMSDDEFSAMMDKLIKKK